ncbi:DUF3047 domain-containing protein [Psychrobium sp. 1_MG-2023]|uniref:DUF3047 domain-containing protein n=1 Tax=Psychrobium sp. 1_MG-2023 TaxID=3062624 RepID=UPI00351EA2B9
MKAQYACRLPRCAEQQIHIVQRSGHELLGEKLRENRNLFEDYQQYINGGASKVTRIWLIANSVFMRGTGQCSYSDISLESKTQKITIL